jgi:hypothetical protein
MIRGRTRGLPIQIDRSIMTPVRSLFSDLVEIRLADTQDFIKRELDKHGDPPEKPMQDEGPAQEAQQEA